MDRTKKLEREIQELRRKLAQAERDLRNTSKLLCNRCNEDADCMDEQGPICSSCVCSHISPESY